MISVNRRGITIHLMASLILGVVILGFAAYLSSNRLLETPPLLLRLKAQYQMESGILLLFQKLTQGPNGGAPEANTFQPRQQMIAPGVVLSLLTTAIDPNHIRLEARIEGEGLQGQLVAQAERSNEPAEAGPTSARSWRLIPQKP